MVMLTSWLVALFALLYAAVFLLGLTGNLAVIYVVQAVPLLSSPDRRILFAEHLTATEY